MCQTTLTVNAVHRKEIEEILGKPAIDQEDANRVLDLYDQAVYDVCQACASGRATERLIQEELGQEAYTNLMTPITKYGAMYMEEVLRYEKGEFGEYPSLFGENPSLFGPCCGKCGDGDAE